MTNPSIPGSNRLDESQDAAAGRTLVDAVYRKLLVEITSGRLLPGQKLPFAMLQRTYESSVTTLREALQRLAAEGLVASKGHVGFSVASVSVKELTDLQMLRLTLEPLALEDSIRNGGARWEELLLVADHRLRQMPIPADLHSSSADQWEDAHRAFHDAMIAGCANATLLQFSRTLFEQVRRYRRIFLRRYWTNSQVRRPVELEHKAILDFTLSKNVARAKQALHLHYSNGFDRMIAEYRNPSADATE